MSTAGPNTAGTGASVVRDGSAAWVNPTNAQGSANGIFATMTGTPVIRSDWLQVTNFGFSIPAGSTIVGILLEINVKQAGVNQAADNSVSLLKAGAASGADKATGASIPTTLTLVAYGSSSDLWSTTWTATDINNTNFGAQYSVGLNNGTPTVSVDNVQITVTYTLPTGGPHLTQTRQAVIRAATR